MAIERTNIFTGVLLLLFLVVIGATELAWSSPWTPLEWQDSGKNREWVRDTDRNFIDDLIDDLILTESPEEKISVTVAFNRCVTDTGKSEAIDFLRSIGSVVYEGKVVTFAIVSDVSLRDIPSISTRPEVAMVELYTPVIPNVDFSTRAIKVRGGTIGASPFTYSPETLEDFSSGLLGNNVNIAVIDSGVDNSHETFAARFVTGCDFTDPGHTGECFAVDPDDQSGHGTHVAGIAMGSGAPDGTKRGVAPEAELIDIKIFRGPDNTNPIGATEAAMEWVILNKDTDWGSGHARGIQVANMSFSGCDNSDGRDVRDQLVNAMVANGIVVASSAGNRRAACGDPASGNVNRIPTVAAATLGITVGNSVVGSLTISPSSFEFMPTVDRGDDEIFFDSLRGPRSDGREKPEVSAPGTAIESARHDTINNYTMRVGTSMSAPHVSGLASIILEEKPEINPGSLKDLLIRTAHRPADPLPDVQNPTWDADWGYGLVDGYQAIWQVTGQGEDQTDITFEGFAGQSHPPDPIWLSPAIRFNSGANEDVVLIGSPNDISVRVLNRDREANNVSVVIGIYYFAASDPDKPQFYEIASLAEDFPVGITDINHSWTPSRDLDIFADPEAHICLRVFIDYGLDSDFSNYSNVAQRNLRRVEISSPAVFKFRVENPLFEDATIHLDVRGEDKNPPGWKFELSDNDFEMDQFACERDIELIVTPPDDPSPGAQATYHVYASATTEKGKNIPLGGLSAQAYVPEKPGLPFVITAVIWAGIIVVIAIAIFFFTKKYRRKEG